MADLVWLITGCSTGFGRELTLEILRRGGKVIATARNVTQIEDLSTKGAATMQFDVTADLPSLEQAAKKANEIYGRIDVLINNAGYVLDGSLEESSPEETYRIFNTNVFGLLNTTRAFLPYMRARRSGVIANVSSIGAWDGCAGAGLYCATKAAVSNLSQSMTYELKEFNISVVSIEPGYFRSNLLVPGNRNRAARVIDDYVGSEARKGMEILDTVNKAQPGDVTKGVKIIVDVLSKSGVAEGREIPLRLPLGADAYETIKGKCDQTMGLLEEWKEVYVDCAHDE